MSAKFFVDTNVLVYCRDTSEANKQARALVWMAALWERLTGRLSFQVLQEFYVTVTVKLSPGFDQAHAEVRDLLTWNPITVDGQLLEEAWRLQDRFQLPWWDSLIVAAALIADCRYLLSEDFQEGMEFGNLKVVNPFLNRPEDFM